MRHIVCCPKLLYTSHHHKQECKLCFSLLHLIKKYSNFFVIGYNSKVYNSSAALPGNHKKNKVHSLIYLLGYKFIFKQCASSQNSAQPDYGHNNKL